MGHTEPKDEEDDCDWAGGADAVNERRSDGVDVCDGGSSNAAGLGQGYPPSTEVEAGWTQGESSQCGSGG